MKINRLNKQKQGYLITIWSDNAFEGFRCKLDIGIFAWRVTWNYAYNPFKYCPSLTQDIYTPEVYTL